MLFNSCKDNGQEKLEPSDIIVSNQEEIDEKPFPEYCSMDHSELSNFIYETKKDVDLLLDFEYDDSEYYFFTNAEKFQDDALVLITCENLSENQKRLLFQLMNGLGYEKYFKFIDNCYDLYKSGQISSGNFYYVLFNSWRKRHYVAKYYENEELILLLNKILKDDVLLEDRPFLKDKIQESLTGEYWEERKAFYTSDAIMDEKALEGW